MKLALNDRAYLKLDTNPDESVTRYTDLDSDKAHHVFSRNNWFPLLLGQPDKDGLERHVYASHTTNIYSLMFVKAGKCVQTTHARIH